MNVSGEIIEQGTDPLDPNGSDTDSVKVFTETPNLSKNTNSNPNTLQRRKSKSVGYSEETKPKEIKANSDLGSQHLLNKTEQLSDSSSLPHSMEDTQCEFLQKWLDSGPALVCSEENLYPEEILGFTQETEANPLTMRTEALLNRTSFNLVKPKFS